MSYSVIHVPFEKPLAEMDDDDLRAYAEWFHGIAAKRIDVLSASVVETLEFRDWRPTESPDSLSVLSTWFESQVQTRPRSEREIAEIRSRLKFQVDIAPYDLTERTFSVAMDVGIYLARVVLKNIPGTKWDQTMRDRRDSDYGRPVIAGFGLKRMDPVHIVTTRAYATAKGKRAGIRELYDTWAKLAN